MKKILFPFLLFIGLVSCEQEADIELPDTAPKLTVSCFISPEQDSATAFITWSRPVFSTNDDRPIDDLEVSITDGSSIAFLQFNPNFNQYVLPLTEYPLVPGVEYTLSVKAPTGEEVEARTVIPAELPSIESATLDSSSYSNSSWEEINDFTYKTTLLNNSADFQYYRLIYYNEDVWFPGKEYASIEGQSYSDDGSLVNDRLYIEENITYYGYNGAVSNKLLAVLNCSEAYYRYHKTLQNQNFGNPFAEPTIVFSNIEGGLGAFGAYRMVEVEY